MKVLYTAFNGKNNSSKILLDTITATDKLYLKNNFNTSVTQLIDKIKNNNYDLVVSLGQAPIEKDTIKIETKANMEDYYETNYDFHNLKSDIEKNFKVIISNNAGNYLCNNVYYYGLKFIYENKLKTKMIFIHIPKINNISCIEMIANAIKIQESNQNE